jgi:hypothetical protein
MPSVDEIQNPYLVLYHDFEQKTKVYLNGELIAEGPEHQAAYTLFELGSEGKKSWPLRECRRGPFGKKLIWPPIKFFFCL